MFLGTWPPIMPSNSNSHSPLPTPKMRGGNHTPAQAAATAADGDDGDRPPRPRPQHHVRRGGGRAAPGSPSVTFAAAAPPVRASASTPCFQHGGKRASERGSRDPERVSDASDAGRGATADDLTAEERTVAASSVVDVPLATVLGHDLVCRGVALGHGLVRRGRGLGHGS